MTGASYNLAAQVKVLGTVAGFAPGSNPQGILLDSRQEHGGHAAIQSIDVVNSMGSPFGRFTIHLGPVPAPPVTGYYAEVFQPYSLVCIALHRSGGPPGDLAATRKPVPVILGVLDTISIIEDLSGTQPQRLQVLSGRSLSAVLSDHKWWFHNYLQAHPDEVPEDFRKYYTDIPSDAEFLHEQQLADAKGFLAIDPQFLKLPFFHPVDVMKVIYDFFVTGATSTQSIVPFIRVGFADGSTFAERMRFDAETAKAAYLDQRAQLEVAELTPTLKDASCWGAMQQFSEQYINEFYQDTFGTSVDDAFCEIISRKPPFLGSIDYDSKDDAVVSFDVQLASGNTVHGAPKFYGQSLFEPSPTHQEGRVFAFETIDIDGNDVLQRSIHRGFEGSNVFTTFAVIPSASAATRNSTFAESVGNLIPPILDVSPNSPNFIFRYGVHPMELWTRSIPITDAKQSSTDVPRASGTYARQAGCYQALLYEWHHRSSMMWRGSMVLKGRTSFRVGTRLVDHTASRVIGRKREYYVTGVRHRMSFTGQPSYTTTLELERGWDIGHD